MNPTEQPEVYRFLNFSHNLLRTVSQHGAHEASLHTGLAEARLEPYFRETCEHLLFELFAAIDGVSGPADLPKLEIALVDGRRFNANFLHDLFIDTGV